MRIRRLPGFPGTQTLRATSLVFISLCLGTAATAQPKLTDDVPSVEEPTLSPAIVEIYVVTEPARYEQVRQVVGEHALGSAKLRWSRLVRFSANALLQDGSNTNTRVRCYIDLSLPSVATLYFADGNSRRFLFRELPLSHQLDAIELETIAQIVEFSINALLNDATEALSRTEAATLLARARERSSINRDSAAANRPSPAAPPSLPIKNAPNVHDSMVKLVPMLALGAGVESLSKQLGMSPSLVATAGVSGQTPAFNLRIAARGAFLPADTYRNELSGAALAGYRLLLVGTAMTPLSTAKVPGLLLGLLVSSGVELLRVKPEPGTLDQMTKLTESQWTTVPLVIPGLRLQYNTPGSIAIALEGTLACSLKDVSYEVAIDSGQSRVFALNRFRPGLLLELGWN